MKNRLFLLFIGIVVWPIRKILPIQKGLWVFGAQGGQRYTQNSKYLFEYLLNQMSDVFWITQSKEVYEELKNQEIPVVYNLSLKGVLMALRAEYVVFSTECTRDILFTCKRRQRKIINVWHGMPMKKIGFDNITPPSSFIAKSHTIIWNYFIGPLKLNDANFVPSTSVFFSELLKHCFRTPYIFDLGQPRTDAFFSWNKKNIRTKNGFSEDKYIILYMPTHRAFGKGKMNPAVFKANASAIDFFTKNNILLIWKFHINMLKDYTPDSQSHDVFLDLSLTSSDPQELLYVADMLITDYSSCYIDYLLLDRPILFYLYDDYENKDNEVYFSPLDHNLGDICRTEDELLEAIKKRKGFSNQFIPSVNYHTHRDGKSCERIYNYINQL